MVDQPARCRNCGFAIYRFGDIWRHYRNDSEFCTPSLSYLEACGMVAEPVVASTTG